MSLFQNLRAMYGTFSYDHRVLGFDTFDGLPGVTSEDAYRGLLPRGLFGLRGFARGVESKFAPQ